MAAVFNQIKIRRDKDYNNKMTRAYWEFFISGVNSGVHKPATLVITTKIEEYKPTFFGNLKRRVHFSEMVMLPQEFDILYNEMTKIKELRDKKTLTV